jgi:acylphosphatase
VSRRSIGIAALVAAATVFLAGLIYTIARDRSYESVATVVLSPSQAEPENISSLLESFERSGTLGTYVELMASNDTTAEAREMGVSITVRAVPDTRAIRVIAEGGKEEVQPALQSVIEATRNRQTALSDLYVLEVLESPSERTQAGPSTGILLLATLLLSIFAAVGTVAILRRFGPQRRAPIQGDLFRSGPTRPEP